MTILAKIVCDSIAPNGKRLTTFELKYPRFIHSELMTHRTFSRNASSSRAIPTKKILADVIKDPAMPVYWGKNQAGMQAKTELSGILGWLVLKIWLWARWPAVAAAWALNKIGLHKQIANRIIEPWAHITTLVTATEYDGFFRLRCHMDAQPEIRKLALMMEMLLQYYQPKQINSLEWHLPFISAEDKKQYQDISTLRKLSVARCARVSYLTHDKKKPSCEDDIKLHDKLLESGHMSPFEHQAMAMTNLNWSGNFRGWYQNREAVDKHFIKVGKNA